VTEIGSDGAKIGDSLCRPRDGRESRSKAAIGAFEKTADPDDAEPAQRAMEIEHNAVGFLEVTSFGVLVETLRYPGSSFVACRNLFFGSSSQR
jgi:hypothetical protein